MTALITITPREDGQLWTTSMNIAEVFGKEHKHVLRDIESLLWDPEFDAPNFGLIEYQDSRGRSQRGYRLTEDWFTLLAMGYTGERAMQFKKAYIKEFRRMREYIAEQTQPIAVPTTMKEALMLALKSEEEKERALLLAESRRPKAEAYDRYMSANGTESVANVAKSLGTGQNRLFNFLRSRGVFKGRLPKQKYIDRGYFRVVQTEYRHGDIFRQYSQAGITPKGVEFIRRLMDKPSIVDAEIIESEPLFA